MQQSRRGVLEFADFRLDVTERRLLKNDQPVPLPPKLFDLLVVLAHNHGRLLEKDDLLQQLWPDTFVEESNLTVNISALRRALGEHGHFIETVPKRGYRFAAPVLEIDFPPAPPAAVGALPRSRRSVLAVAITAAVCIGVLLSWLIVRRDPGAVRIKSLVILPFSTLASDQSQEYLGLGMADAIITRLARIDGVNIPPTSAVTKYSGRSTDPSRVAQELHVEATVQGRIQQVDKRIRVTVQLTRAKDGKQLWADAFDDSFNNIFVVQDEIAENIAAILSMNVTESEQKALTRRYTQNTEAYRLYLQGQYLSSKRLNEATINAISYYEKSIAADPAYPLPYAALAHSCIIRAGEGFGAQFRDKAKAAALKVLEMDPSSSDAHIAVGEVLMRADQDWKAAEDAFRQAVKLNPKSAAAHAAMATLHTAIGRHSEAISEMQTACRLEPASASLRSDLAWALEFGRRFPEAIEQGKKALELDAWSYSAHRQLGKAYLLNGMYLDAVQEAKRCLEINGGRRRRVLAELAAAHAAAGNRSDAEQMLREAKIGAPEDPAAHYEIAVAYARLHQPELAFNSLGAAVEQRLTRILWMNADPEMDPLRNDPRFTSLLRRANLR